MGSQNNITIKTSAKQDLVLFSAVLLPLVMLFYWPQLILGKALYWGDIGVYFLPMQQFLHSQLHLGKIPLWNPYLLCGAPFVGNPQTWPLYPPAFSFNFLPPAQAINVTLGFHIWLAGVGMAFWIRRSLQLPVTACLFSAVIFMFGGHFISKEQFPNMLHSEAYAPWILMAVERLVRSKRSLGQKLDTATHNNAKERQSSSHRHPYRDKAGPSACAVLAISIALQLLCAHAQIALLTLYLALIYGIYLLFHFKVYRTKIAYLIGTAIASVIIAIAFSAAQLLPVIEFTSYSWRTHLSFYDVNRFYLPVKQIGNFVLPAIFGHPFYGSFTARGNFWETCCYVGLLPLICVIAGIIRAWLKDGDRIVRFWSVMLPLSVLMATGGAGKLYYIAWLIVPGFKSFHDPARCLLVSAVSISVIAPYGLYFLSRLIPGKRRAFRNLHLRWALAALFVLITFIDLTRFGRTIYPVMAPDQLVQLKGMDAPAYMPDDYQIVRNVTGDPYIRRHIARMISPDTSRAWQRFTSKRSYRQNVKDYDTLWCESLTPNINMSLGLMDVYGYDPVTRSDVQSVLTNLKTSYDADATLSQRNTAAVLTGLYGGLYVINDHIVPPHNEISGLTSVVAEPTLARLSSVDNDSLLYLSRNKYWKPRVRLTSRIVSMPTQKQSIETIKAYNAGQSDINLQTETLVTAQSLPVAYDKLPAGNVTLVNDNPDEMLLKARNTIPCLLVVADTLHPGWHAKVDGVSSPVYSVNGFNRGVLLQTAGLHNVSFIYKPASFLIGLYLSLFTFMLFVVYYTNRVYNKIVRHVDQISEPITTERVKMHDEGRVLYLSTET